MIVKQADSYVVAGFAAASVENLAGRANCSQAEDPEGLDSEVSVGVGIELARVVVDTPDVVAAAAAVAVAQAFADSSSSMGLNSHFHLRLLAFRQR